MTAEEIKEVIIILKKEINHYKSRRKMYKDIIIVDNEKNKAAERVINYYTDRIKAFKKVIRILNKEK